MVAWCVLFMATVRTSNPCCSAKSTYFYFIVVGHQEVTCQLGREAEQFPRFTSECL